MHYSVLEQRGIADSRLTGSSYCDQMGNAPSAVPQTSATLAELQSKVHGINRLMLRKEVPLVLECTTTEENARWRNKLEVVCLNNTTHERRVLDFDAFHAFYDFLRDSVSRSVVPGVSSSGSEPEAGGGPEARINTIRLSDGVTMTPGGGGGAGEMERECCVCLERNSEMLLPCLHAFCEQCIVAWAEKNDKCADCPVCRTPIVTASWADSWQLVEDTPLLPFVWAEIVRRGRV